MCLWCCDAECHSDGVKLGIRLRIVLALALLALLVASAAVIAALTHQRLHAEVDAVARAERRSRAALELSQGVRDLYAHQAHTIILGDRSHLDHYELGRKQVTVLLDVLAGLAPDASAIVGELGELIAAFEANFAHAIVPAIGGPPAALVGPHDRALAMVESITRRVDELALRFRQDADAAQRRADAGHEAEIAFHVALVVAAILFALAVAIYLMRAIARPLGDLRRGAARLASGDLGTRIAVPADQDFGALATAFNTMASELEAHQHARVAAEKLASVGRIAAGIAHEINNPLAVILGYARLLQRGADPSVSDDARRIAAEAERCSAIVRGLLDLARPAQLDSAHVGALDLAELVRDVADASSAAGVGVVLELSPAPPWLVSGDGKKLRQIVTNLLRNAAEAAPGEAIVVRFEADAKHAVLHVSDRGPGVAAGIDLFEPFQTSKPDGTGLGLAVSRALARAHGGELAFSANPTTFTLTLPRSAPSPAQLGEQRSATSEEQR